MTAEIISVGGFTPYEDIVDASVKAITERLNEFGAQVRYHTSVEKQASEVKHALKTAVGRSDIIVISGGVGSDESDISVDAVCSAIGMGVIEDKTVLEALSARVGASDDKIMRAARVPEEAEVFLTDSATAPGCVVSAEGQSIIMLPSDIQQTQQLMKQIVAYLKGDEEIVIETVTPSEPEIKLFEADEELVFKVASIDGIDEPVLEDNGAENVLPLVDEAVFDAVIASNEIEYEDDTDDGEDNIVEEASDEADEEPTPPAEEGPLVDEAVFDAIQDAEPEEVESQNTRKDIWAIDSIVEMADSIGKDAEVSEELVAVDSNETALTETKRTPLAVKVVKHFIPWKNDGLVDVVRKIVFFVALIAFVVSGIYVSNYFINKFENDKLVSEMREMYDRADTTVNKDGVLNRFAGLLKQNSDCIGWLTIPNSKVDTAVYQAEDNDYYINHNSLKQKSVYGALFADYRNIIKPNTNSQNITIYGHHMKDGTMLADIHKYKDINFYKENPVVSFDTIYGTGGSYKVFACMITNADSKDDNGYFFDFSASEFESKADFLSWIEQIRRRSLYITPVDVRSDDDILTLSTCTYEIRNVELRCVVVARKVRADEDIKVNTAESSYNSKVIYPAVWYQKFGGSKPEYADGLTTWLSQPDQSGTIGDAEMDVPSVAPPVTETSSAAASSNSSAATSSQAAASTATSSQAASSQGTASTAPVSSEAAPPSSSAETPSQAESNADSSTAQTSSEPAASSEPSVESDGAPQE